MSILEALICGAVQGACEFLPISSSGHLALLDGIFGVGMNGDNVAFDVLLHFGTLVAVVVAYRRDIYRLLSAFFKMLRKIFAGKFRFSSAEADERTLLWLMLATVPLAFAALIKDKIETMAEYPRYVGAALMINGAMLLVSTFIKNGRRSCSDIGALGALGTGAFQLMATIPGLSRSGSTITGGVVFGLSREEAVRFSFLLSIPAIIGANIFSAADMIKSGAALDPLPCAVGTLAAAAVGAVAIKIIKKLANSKNFGLFGVYCILIGAFAVIHG